MPRLNTIDPDRTDGTTKELLGKVKAKLGMVPNLTRVMANSPAVLEGYLGLSGALAGGSLPPRLRELLAVDVAQTNGCDYCLSAHTAAGKRLGLSHEQIIAGRKGTSDDPKTAAALGFARKIAAHRGQVSDDDLEEVRDAGYSDGEIAEIIGHVALNTFTNYVNNVAETDIDFPPTETLDPREACASIPGCDATR